MVNDAGDIVEQIQTVLARMQRLDLWPPWDAVSAVVDAIRHLRDITTQPPAPAPDDLDDAADGWHRIGLAWDQAAVDIRHTRTRVREPGVWEGATGQVLDSSVGVLADRVDTVPEVAWKVENALQDCSTDMTSAHRRWSRGREDLRDLLSFGLSDLPLNPADAAEKLLDRIADAARAGRELTGAYQDGHDAVRTATATITGWVDTIDLPTALVPGTSAVDQVNLFDGGAGNDTRPLRGTAAWRAQAALDAMTPDQRAHAQALIDNALDGVQRGWILAAVAAGMSGKPLDRYAQHLTTMTPEELSLMDGTTTENGAQVPVFTQPDGTTCGASSLVMARMLNDPGYAMYITTGYDVHTGLQTPTITDDVATRDDLPQMNDPALKQPQLRFHQAALDMHAQTNDARNNGTWQVPWPGAVGTQPWAAANQMSGTSGVPGSDYTVQIVDPTDRTRTYDQIIDAADNGHAVPVYSYDIDTSDPHGSGAHVVLVVGTDGDDLKVYDPGRGEVRTVTRNRFVDAPEGQGREALGWDRPMAAVLPK